MTINLMENSLFFLSIISCKKPYLKISKSIKVQFRHLRRVLKVVGFSDWQDSTSKDQKRGREREENRENKINNGPLDKDLASWNIQIHIEAKYLC